MKMRLKGEWDLKVLAINPGSTSTKVAAYENETCLWKQGIDHPASEINAFECVGDQYKYRSALILKILDDKKTPLESFDGIVGRGGLLNPLEGGTYLVDRNLVHTLHNAPGGEHASNLGGIIAFHLDQLIKVKSLFDSFLDFGFRKKVITNQAIEKSEQ